MKSIGLTLIAMMALVLVGCIQWHSAGPTAGQTTIPAWSQVQVGMTKQQVYAVMGKPRRETAEMAEWRGPEVKKGWPSDHPATIYSLQYEAYFDTDGRVKGMRDFDTATPQ